MQHMLILEATQAAKQQKVHLMAALVAVMRSYAPGSDQADAPVPQAHPQRTQPSNAARLVPHLCESSTRVLYMQSLPSHILCYVISSKLNQAAPCS